MPFMLSWLSDVTDGLAGKIAVWFPRSIPHVDLSKTNRSKSALYYALFRIYLAILNKKNTFTTSIDLAIFMKKLFKTLYFQVIVAIIIGAVLGHFYPDLGVALKPFGDGFIKLIKMIIAPLIFCS